MKYKLAVFIVISVIWSGCVILPEPIDEVYLEEKTGEEAARLGKIEADIIAKKKDKDKIGKDLEIAAQKVEISRKEVSEIEAANSLLLEKEKLYILQSDNQKIADIQKEKGKGKIRSDRAKAFLDYNLAKKNETNALLELKTSELAVRVAELDYEKALIAKVFQLKRSEEFKKDMIDDSEYKKFMDNQKKGLDEYKKKYEKALKALQEAEEKFTKSGYTDE